MHSRGLVVVLLSAVATSLAPSPGRAVPRRRVGTMGGGPALAVPGWMGVVGAEGLPAAPSAPPSSSRFPRVVAGSLTLAALAVPCAASAAAPGGLDVAQLPAIQSALDSTFLQATSLIFLSEIGDKTFFIASILAAKASRLITFVGSFGALAVMTVISVVVGQIFHAVPESLTGGLPLDDYVAIGSFVYFGVKSIADALSIEEAGEVMAEELADAEDVLAKGDVLERTRGKALKLAGEAFALTVAAEIGDRSQLATIALSAAQNPYAVCGGACFGHGLATGIAVLGGSFISKYTNEKTVGLIGGVLFLLFAATTAFGTF